MPEGIMKVGNEFEYHHSTARRDEELNGQISALAGKWKAIEEPVAVEVLMNFELTPISIVIPC